MEKQIAKMNQKINRRIGRIVGVNRGCAYIGRIRRKYQKVG